jgi:hypothetical protein
MVYGFIQKRQQQEELLNDIAKILDLDVKDLIVSSKP